MVLYCLGCYRVVRVHVPENEISFSWVMLVPQRRDVCHERQVRKDVGEVGDCRESSV